jgi:hypothetical protein
VLAAIQLDQAYVIPTRSSSKLPTYRCLSTADTETDVKKFLVDKYKKEQAVSTSPHLQITPTLPPP